MLRSFHGLQIWGQKRLPKEDKIGERFGWRGLGITKENDLLLPNGAFHGDESDIAIGDLLSHALHITDDAVNLMVFTLEEVKAVLDSRAAERFKLFAEEGLMLGFGHIISKHHEHGARKGGRGTDFERGARG